MRFTRKVHPAVSALLVFGFFWLYYFCLPYTIQTNDTGETVGNAYLLHLIHPPGYPLYMWLYHAFTNLVVVSTPFFRASLFTSLLACGTLAFLAALKPARTWPGLIVLSCLGTARIFWEYAVLPDVFMLHLLIVAAQIYVFMEVQNGRRRVFALATLMALGVANHHTVIFLSPLFFAAAWEHRSVRDNLLAAVWSLVLCASLYLTLFLVTHEHLLDWRKLQGLNDLWHHFLRSEYGTFRLTVYEDQGTYWKLFVGFLATLNLSMGLLLIGTAAGVPLAALHVWRRRGFKLKETEGRFLVIASVLLVYVGVFLPLCNLPLDGYFASIMERFFLMPALLFAVLGLYGFFLLWPQLRSSLRWAIGIAGVLLLGLNLSQRHRVDYSRDTLIEDYTIDLLKRAGSKPDSILMVRTDTVLFGARYLQAVEKIHPEIPVMILSALQRPHMIPVISKMRPQANLQEGYRFSYAMEGNFAVENFGKLPIFSMLPFPAGQLRLLRHRVGYEVIGAKDYPRRDDPIPETNRARLEDLPGFEGRISLRLFGLRCDYELDLADEAYYAGRAADVKAVLESALKRYPYCFGGYRRLCQLYANQPSLGDSNACMERFEEAQRIYHGEYEDFLSPQ